MSNRIHKIMGYGLTDVKSIEFQITDPRFNPKSLVIDKELNLTVKDYYKFLKNKDKNYEVLLEKSNVRQHCKKKSDLSRCFIYDGEMGSPNVFVIVPPYELQEWTRYDDAIDYTEHVSLSISADPIWRVLDNGIYPYLGHFNRDTGKKIDSWETQYLRGLLRTSEQYPRNLDEECRRLGLKNCDDIDRIGPIIPPPVRFLAEFAEIFTDPQTINELKPIFYIYWS